MSTLENTSQSAKQPGTVHVIDTRPGARPGGPILDNIEGAEYGAGVSLILEDTDVDGAGPALHQHPYPETFVIHAGMALFTVADRQVVGEAGMVLVVPPYTPHKFAVIGPDRYRATHIHASERFITEWLEGPLARRSSK
ncbi:MAG TPA: cupin domain-containing protein [Glaciibacter sp.]|nr:cupin domain-containing protein [Glaciibacter sp.]